MIKQCEICYTEFFCASEQSNTGCWCQALPAIMPNDSEHDCRCKVCLAKDIAKRIKTRLESCSLEQMLAIAKDYNNGDGLVENIDYTIENGHYVFSRWYHLKRGTCCGNGCRHCPY